ncbi:hypothetical protein TVAG_397460 [Trichomonas vaginalis G3]|uniref:Uncharacterized protein n=1 Tax=Trichomonas vaginalis (strain ATCC PRA-98 / G3) TaxID=412133 RepID=A2G1C3_TRIV3|nr:protein ubiquitination [Trichomonas vaginalis G3]EAX89039.1 hypothetical protein TVAG_397460 [Trichomonas vaginalis G3]KAI5513147.1 protein ubiquitination [Trichomonas vaginalis G3]|eukprot:XP_001301969.1 hypothetical protein [Trichomonas vaginalis G3]
MSNTVVYSDYGKHFMEYVDDDMLYTAIEHNDIKQILNFTTIKIDDLEKFIFGYNKHHNNIETLEALLNISGFEFGDDINRVLCFLNSLSKILSTPFFSQLSSYFKNVTIQNSELKSNINKLNETIQNLKNEHMKLIDSINCKQDKDNFDKLNEAIQNLQNEQTNLINTILSKQNNQESIDKLNETVTSIQNEQKQMFQSIILSKKVNDETIEKLTIQMNSLEKRQGELKNSINNKQDNQGTLRKQTNQRSIIENKQNEPEKQTKQLTQQISTSIANQQSITVNKTNGNPNSTKSNKFISSLLMIPKTYDNVSSIYFIIKSAALENNTETIEFALNNGYLDTFQSKYWNSDYENILCYATKENDVKTVKALVDYGVNPNITSENGRTALHIACKNQDIQLIQILAPVSNLSAIDSSDYTPLMLAITSSGYFDSDQIGIENSFKSKEKSVFTITSSEAIKTLLLNSISK